MPHFVGHFLLKSILLLLYDANKILNQNSLKPNLLLSLNA